MKKLSQAMILLVFVVLLLALIPDIMAHAPLGSGDNESLAGATVVPDPLKSWALYAELHVGGEANYYKFNITEDQRIHIMLYKSRRSEEAGFSPSLALMGPGLTAQGSVPSYVEIPSGVEVLVVQGQQASVPTYEPFSPSSFYSMADLETDAPVSGTYYIVVFEPNAGGHYGLAVGDQESYTVDEWILIPFSLMSIYQWEGQSLMLVLYPMIITVIVGLALIIWRMYRMRTRGTVMMWLGSLAGLLFVGTGVTTLFEMILSLAGTPIGAEVAITLIFALIPILLGAAALRLSRSKNEKASVRKRVYLAVLGVAALFIWAGLIIGPALAIVASVSPGKRTESKN